MRISSLLMALAVAILTASCPRAQDVAVLSARGQLGHVFYQRAGGARTAMSQRGAVGSDVLNLRPGDQVWIDAGARASAAVVYADSGVRVALGAGGRHRIRRPTRTRPGLTAVLGEAARALITMLSRRDQAPTDTGFSHAVSRGQWAPALVIPDASRPWNVLPGAAPLAWDGATDGRAGDTVRLWTTASAADCSAETLVSDAPLSTDDPDGRPVFDARAALEPGRPYRIELVSAGGRTRAAGCVWIVPASHAEPLLRAAAALGTAAEARPAASAEVAPRAAADPATEVLAAALLADRGFVPDALLRLGRALALDPDDVGAARLQAAIRASLLRP